MIVAIDGVAGSGKSSTARAVARKLGFLHLDSGALYRAFAYAAVRAGATATESLDERIVQEAARAEISVEITERRMIIRLEGQELEAELRTPEVTALSSRMAGHGPIRDEVNRLLRQAASRHPRGVVCEGRDMGTVVFPDAELKVYMTASGDERARRRLRERGEAVDSEAVSEEAGRLEGRDRTDMDRALSPLRRAPDATVLDTTDLTFSGQVDRIVRLARERLTH